VSASSIRTRTRATSATTGTWATWLVGFYPVLWACGLAGFLWPAVALCTLSLWARSRLRTYSGAVLALIFCLVLSTGVGLAAGYGSLDRVLGFGGNLAIWVGLFGLLCATSSWDRAAQRRFLMASIIAGVANGCVAVASIAMYPNAFPLPLAGALAPSFPPALRAFTSNELVTEDWLGETVLRTNGTMGFPTWSGAVSALTIILVVIAVRQRLIRLSIALFAVSVSVVAVYYAFSRAVQMALLAAALYAVLRIVWRKLRIGPLIVMALFSATAVLAYLNVAKAVRFVADINAEREGSAESRGAIYAETLSRVSDLTVPFLGYGMKPRQEDLLASVASHSTYLGLLFKAGILGLLAFLVLLFACWRESDRAPSSLPSAMVLFIGLWCIFEDFDTGHLVPAMLVSALCAAQLDLHDRAPTASPANSPMYATARTRR
jgi:hypothetical protein